MKQYFICKKEVAHQNANLFHAQTGGHYKELEDGYILLACDFHNEWAEQTWFSIPGIEPLPHPMFDGFTPIHSDHAHALRHHGVEHGDNVIHVAQKMSKHHPLMGLHHHKHRK